jgi:hypothetical protein
MRPEFPRLTSRTRGAAIALAIMVALSTSALAQLGTFDSQFDGELWRLRRELTPGGGAIPAGLAFVNGTMFVADSANRTVIAYDNAGQLVSIPGAQWNTADPLSPAFGLVPHQLAAAVVNVNGTDRDALLISDEQSNRVAAFDVTGAYLFTLRLQRPAELPPLPLTISIGQIAMSPGARFNFTTATSTLTLTGAFAAGWFEQEYSGHVFSGALAFAGASATFMASGVEFLATPTSVLTGTESDPVAPPPLYVHGVTFDSNGNLYVLDAYTEGLHVYGPAFTHLFTFGTPEAGGGSAEFYEPWGLAFWPDATGTSGRILVNDTYNNRIMIYRPVDGDDAGTVIDALQFETVIEDFVAPAAAIEVFSIAVDPETATIAVTDFAQPRVVVLQRPRLAAFNLQLLDDADQIIPSVCADTSYKVRFSLTVPAGLAAVNGVMPTLLIDGVPASAVPVPAATYPSTQLAAGEVMTFTYSLPGIAADVAIVAGAIASDTSDIASRSATIAVAQCQGETDPTTFTLVPAIPAQVSGWTPVPEGRMYSVTVNAQDDDGLERVEYELHGATQTPGTVTFDDGPTGASVLVLIPEFGRTTLRYRARDGNGIWSEWQLFDVRVKQVLDRSTNENVAAEFRVGDPEGTGFTYSVQGLPEGMSFSSSTGQFAGVISFDANQPYSTDPVLSTGVYNVVVTETAPGGASSSVGFTWTINNVNRSPIIANPAIAGVAVLQGTPFELQINGADPDGDPSLFTINGYGVNTGQDLPLSIDPVTGVISGVFPMDSDTEYQINVALAECSERTVAPPCNLSIFPGNKLATLLGFSLVVLDTNLPADIVNPGPQSSVEGAVVTLPVHASDAEGDALTFEAAGLPAGLSIDPMTGVISGTVSYDAAGSHAVTVEVNDHVNTPNRSVAFSWTVTATNRPPLLSVPDRVHIEGDTVSSGAALTAFGFDPDGSTLTFVSASGLPPGAVVNAAGVLSGAFGFSAAGVYTVTVRVSDGTAVTDDSFIWTIYNVNGAPTLTPVNQTSREGGVVSYQLPASDPDGDALIFSINGLPPGLMLNESTGLISGTVAPNSIGVYTVNIGVGDLVESGSLSLLRTITWTITSNHPPTANNDVATVTQGSSVSIDVRGNDADPDNDPLTIANITPPTSGLAVLNAATGTITFTAASPTFVGASTFSYTISDGSVTSTATVTVTIVASNAAPVCTAATGGEIWPPNHKRFYAAPIGGVYDPDGNPIAIAITGIFQDEPVDSTGDGQFAHDGRVENGQAWIRAERSGHGNKAAGNGRVYEITFTATDGNGGSCTGSAFWTVPHNQGQSSSAIDDGTRYDSMSATAGARDKNQKSPKP